jgi:hypothetical protein
MTDRLEVNMVRLLIISTLITVAIWALNACVVQSDAGLPHGCDVCAHVVTDAGGDSQ